MHGGVRTCALACAFWLWAFFGGPFHIRGIARTGEGLGCPRFPSDAKQVPLEPRKAPRISEKPLPGVRGGTEGRRGISRIAFQAVQGTQTNAAAGGPGRERGPSRQPGGMHRRAPWAGGCTGTSLTIGNVGKGIAAFSGPKCTCGTVGAAPHGGENGRYVRGRVRRPSPR